MSSVTIKELLDSGVHFGHQTRRWNPRMQDYIFESRNKIHIIDIRKSLRLLTAAMEFIRDVVADGQDVLLVGTKKQAREILKESAERLQMHYVVDRWLGGALTNFQTIRLSINRLIELEGLRDESALEGRSKKEIASLRREEHKLHRNLDGIRAMEKLPGVMVVIDIGRELNAVREARKLGIPIVALIDTNCDPTLVDLPIPGNDDGIRSTKLIISKIEEAIAEGIELRKKNIAENKSGEGKKRPASRKKKVKKNNAPPPDLPEESVSEPRSVPEEAAPEPPTAEVETAPEPPPQPVEAEERSEESPESRKDNPR